MWVSKKKWKDIEKRVADLEKKVQDQLQDETIYLVFEEKDENIIDFLLPRDKKQ